MKKKIIIIHQIISCKYNSNAVFNFMKKIKNMRKHLLFIRYLF